MTAFEHALIAMAMMIGTYLWGKYMARREFTNDVEDLVESTLETLEKEGFIATKTNMIGEKELIKIEEFKNLSK
jgi:hypothetical protein